MANNRVTYATAQLALKDNRADATTRIMGWLPRVLLGANITDTGTAVTFKKLDGSPISLSGFWGKPTMFRIKTGAGAFEYIRITNWTTASGATVTRGAGGTTAAAHNGGDFCQLTGWEVPLGVQSVSIGTTLNTEDIFTLGQLDPYENREGIPDVEVSVERVFDGTKPLYLIATDPAYATLKGRTANYKADLAVSVYPDTQDSCVGSPDSTVCVSGCYISAWSASFTQDGNFTESATLVGNDKTWGGEEGVPSGYFLTSDAYDAAIIGSGVQRTENFDRANSTLPSDIAATDHIQSIEVSVDITREDIMQLGSKTPYFRSVSWPVTITTTIEVITDKGDGLNVLGNGRRNITNQTIILKTKEGLTIDLGTKNKIASVSFEGMDAGGGNGTCTFEYTTSNHLDITHTGFPDAYSTNNTPLRR